jgi:hypothetical protein
LIYLYPGCSDGFLVRIPITWYPARIIDYLLYHDMTIPVRMRYTALVILVAWLCLLVILASRLLKTPIAATAPVVLTSLCFGVPPFLLAVNRPEQGLVAVHGA